MAPRLIVISNRVALPTSGRQWSAGGLAVAVKAALKNRTGLWFGWSGVVSDAPDPEPKIIEKNKTTFAVIDLSTADFQEYYNGLANRVFWPTLHYRVDLRGIFQRSISTATCGSIAISPKHFKNSATRRSDLGA